jgi:hypothetical protein
MKHRVLIAKTGRAILLAVAATIVLLPAAAIFSSPSFAKHRYYYAHDCRTGWWAVRDGHRYWRPSDGMWRPTWATRCYKVRLVR